jgi:hypothetical protein
MVATGSAGDVVRGDTDALIAAHVAGVGMAEAARRAGISRATAWRRMQEPDVRERVAELRTARRDALMAHAMAVQTAADLVLDAVVAILDDDPEPTVVARLAALLVPEVRHLALGVELAERVTAIESAVEVLA